jgi:hypothetical protein
MNESATRQGDVGVSMQRRPLTGMLEINVETLAEVEPTLEAAIQSVSPAAVRYGMGILITQIGLGRYVVRAHPHVPEGFVRRQ